MAAQKVVILKINRLVQKVSAAKTNHVAKTNAITARVKKKPVKQKIATLNIMKRKKHHKFQYICFKGEALASPFFYTRSERDISFHSPGFKASCNRLSLPNWMRIKRSVG